MGWGRKGTLGSAAGATVLAASDVLEPVEPGKVAVQGNCLVLGGVLLCMPTIIMMETAPSQDDFLKMTSRVPAEVAAIQVTAISSGAVGVGELLAQGGEGRLRLRDWPEQATGYRGNEYVLQPFSVRLA